MEDGPHGKSEEVSDELQRAARAYAAGDLRSAVAACRSTLGLHPNHPDALHILGVSHHRLGEAEAGLAAVRQAIQAAPSDRYWQSLGHILADLGRDDEAADAYHAASELAPQNPALHFHRGNALRRMGRHVDAAMAYRAALHLDASHADAWAHLGVALKAMEDWQGAAAACERAARLRPDQPAYWGNLGNTLLTLGRLTEAGAAYETALALPSATPDIYSNHLLALHYRPGMDMHDLAEAHRGYGRRFFDQPPIGPGPLVRRARPRLGFVSPDFVGHPVTYFTLPVIECLSRSADVFLYMNRRQADSFTTRFAALATLRHIEQLDDEAAAATIAADDLDVAIDLAGHTAGNRLPLFARRLAPRQVAWCGYVDTTGLAEMDAIIADRHHIRADEERFYGERVLRMPESWLCALPPTDAPGAAQPPCRTSGIVTFGCFASPAKINPPLLRLWREILQAVPRSRLVLKYTAMGESRERILAALEGIEPERIVIEGHSARDAILRRYGDIDIALDSTPYSGGFTTIEALWMGVPVVTTPGSTFCSRHSTSFLTTAGLNELVAQDSARYVGKAIALAGDVGALSQYRARLRDTVAGSPLMDYEGFSQRFLDLI